MTQAVLSTHLFPSQDYQQQALGLLRLRFHLSYHLDLDLDNKLHRFVHPEQTTLRSSY
jgi:hypothetical protein